MNPSDVLWRQLDATRGWLLLLDNTDDLAALAVGSRAAGSGTGWLRLTHAGLVLVTSQTGDQQTWGPAAECDASGGSAEPMAQVLLDLAPAGGDRAAAQSISGRLGGLPLALHQAGCYFA